MTGKGDQSVGLLADRLDHLFQTVHPKDRGPYTGAEVAEAINRAAGESVISATYVWQLRTGRRDNPTYRHLIAISRFFGVSPMYFFDESESERGAIPAEVAAVLPGRRGPRPGPARRRPVGALAQRDQRHGRQRPLPAGPALFAPFRQG